MSEKRTPQPGEIWRYTIPAVGDRVGVVGAAGRATVIDGDNGVPKTARPVELIGYAARYVDQLRAEPEGDWSKLSRELHAAEALADRRAQQRDAAIARAEKAEAELAAERDKARFPGLDDIARDEPLVIQEVLDPDSPEAVRKVRDFLGLVRVEDSEMAKTLSEAQGELQCLADRLEREHAEKAKRGRLIEEAAATLTRIISGNVIDGYPRNAAAAILAEFPGVINALAEAADQ